jgi:hypothetical protein
VTIRTSSSVFTIASIEDASRLQRCTRSFLALKAESIDVAHPALTESERTRWSARLSFLSKVCGCQAGAIAAIVAIFIAIFDPPFALQTWMATVLAGVGFVLGMSILGKCAVVVVARVILQLEVQRLIRTLAGGVVRTAEG